MLGAWHLAAFSLSACRTVISMARYLLFTAIHYSPACARLTQTELHTWYNTGTCPGEVVLIIIIVVGVLYFTFLGLAYNNSVTFCRVFRG